MMFEITKEIGDIWSLDHTDTGFIGDFINEPSELFNLIEQYFIKGDWTINVSVLFDMPKK